MVREEFRLNAKVLSEVDQGPCRLCFSFHRVDANKVLTCSCLELCFLAQRLDWHSVGAEENTETSTSHGWGVVASAPGDGMDCLACSLLFGAAECESGLGNPDAPFLSR